MTRKIDQYKSWIWRDLNGCEWMILPRHADCQPGQIISTQEGQHVLLINKKRKPHLKNQNIWTFRIMKSIPKKYGRSKHRWFRSSKFKMTLVFKGDRSESKTFRDHVFNVFQWYKDFHPNTTVTGKCMRS